MVQHCLRMAPALPCLEPFCFPKAEWGVVHHLLAESCSCAVLAHSAQHFV